MNGADDLLEHTLPPEDVYLKLPPEEQNVYNYKILRHLLVSFSGQPRVCETKFVTKKQAKIGMVIIAAFLLGFGMLNVPQILRLISFL